MPTSLTFEEQLTFVREAAAALLTEARSESLTDVVPTCPGWTVADLVAHHGGVCRWSARIVAGQRTGNLPPAELTAALAAPTGRRELLDWYADGVAELVEALKSADDGPALVFLPDAPPPRLFWARRSAHEATLHRVDMLSVTLGHLPTAAGTGVPVQLAVDGLDELLMGLVPRPTSQLRADEPIVVSVVPVDSPAAWTVQIGAAAPVTCAGAADDADAVLTGSAAALYLGLWNRGDEIAEYGRAPVLGLWREKVRISWR